MEGVVNDTSQYLLLLLAVAYDNGVLPGPVDPRGHNTGEELRVYNLLTQQAAQHTKVILSGACDHWFDDGFDTEFILKGISEFASQRALQGYEFVGNQGVDPSDYLHFLSLVNAIANKAKKTYTANIGALNPSTPPLKLPSQYRSKYRCPYVRSSVNEW